MVIGARFGRVPCGGKREHLIDDQSYLNGKKLLIPNAI